MNIKNPNEVVAVYQPATVAYSTDGGQSFTLADLAPVPGWRTGGDVSATFDNKGHVYLSSLHFDKLGSASYWAHGAGRNGIFVRRSLDGGKTWEKEAATVKAFQGTEPEIQWEDMPRIFAATFMWDGLNGKSTSQLFCLRVRQTKEELSQRRCASALMQDCRVTTTAGS